MWPYSAQCITAAESKACSTVIAYIVVYVVVVLTLSFSVGAIGMELDYLGLYWQPGVWRRIRTITVFTSLVSKQSVFVCTCLFSLAEKSLFVPFFADCGEWLNLLVSQTQKGS